MPYVSARDESEYMLGLTPYERPEPTPGFGEVFSAALGHIVDEELSISGAMNNEMYARRRETVRQLSESGEIDLGQFTDRRGRVDYDRIAEADERVPHSSLLREERNQILERRRNYSKEVLERGSGLAQFLGSAVGLVADPVNIALLPVATAGTALKGMSTLARAMYVGRNEAALATMAELAIQPLVYEHKHDIESPWEAQDALSNIAMAAAGAFALGGAVGGLSGYFRSVRSAARDMAKGDFELGEATAILERIEGDLEANPARAEVDLDQIEKEFIAEIRAELEATSSRPLSKSERGLLQQELDELRARRAEDSPQVVNKKTGTSTRQQKREGVQADAEDAATDARIEAIEARLESSRWGERTDKELAQLSQGVVPERFRRQLEERQNQKLIDVDTEYLSQKETTLRAANQTADRVEPPAMEPPATRPQITETQAAYLTETGLADDYARAANAYEAVDNPMLVEDGKLVPADDVIGKMDEVIEGLESVRVCAIG